MTFLIPEAKDFPADLTELDNQFALWKWESVRGGKAKVPYTVKGQRASTTNLSHWSSADEAIEAWRHRPDQYAGVAFLFVSNGDMVGVDLDNCLLEDSGVKPWARGLIERFADTYCEISPSGRGVKIWVRGKLPANLPGVRIAGGGSVEMYSRARYFTLTGRVFRGAPLQVENHEEDVGVLYRHLTENHRKVWPLQPLQGGRIPYGKQHSTLVSLAGTLRARRVCDEAIEACLQAINRVQCERPGPPENIARIVRSTRAWNSR